MSYKPILIVPGEPNSIFFEIFFKTLKLKKINSPLILIASKKIIEAHLIKLKFNYKIRLVYLNNLNAKLIDNKKINLIDVNHNYNYKISKISNKSNIYIHKCFSIAFDLLKKKYTNKFINGPVSKKFFLKKKYLGITEFIAKHFNIKNYAMLIYNKNISVCPITTHLPLKYVAKNIKKETIIKKIEIIDLFYKDYLKKKPKFALTGLNPHCESISSFNEDDKIILPSIKILKNKGINVSGPFSADTLFLKNNRSNYDIIVGMYHDQVLTPIKTLVEFDAINVTLGLPFLRISPDHGPNEKMVGKNLSDPLSLIKALKFLDN